MIVHAHIYLQQIVQFPACGTKAELRLGKCGSYVQSSTTVHKNLDAAVAPNSCFIWMHPGTPTTSPRPGYPLCESKQAREFGAPFNFQGNPRPELIAFASSLVSGRFSTTIH